MYLFESQGLTGKSLSDFTLITIIYKWLPTSTTSTGSKSTMKQFFYAFSFMTPTYMKI